MSSPPLLLEVECYSGYRAAERLLSFRGKSAGAVMRTVAKIIDQWYGPDDRFFKVLADDGNLYVLRHSEREDVWTLDSFRVLGGAPPGRE